ncbi:MAG: cell division protein SepF [Coriobacteriia bacterium]|nr:cell division protein SepF [Coriobacteriia bacterium]
MELPKISLDGVKSKLGFAQEEEPRSRTRRRSAGYANDYYDDGQDAYDNFDGEDYDYGQGFGDVTYDTAGYEEPASQYDPYSGDVTTRPQSSTRRPAGVSAPRLVSLTDVRASTPLPTEAPAQPSASGSYRSSRTMVDAKAPLSSAGLGTTKERSESLDNLFGGATQATAPVANGVPAAPSYGAPASSEPAFSATRGTSTFGRDTYSSSVGTTVHAPSRSVEVLRPATYEDVERVAKILRAGDVAVLALSATPADLFSRVLDFSFGVASALDATVDCIAPKVFALSTGAALSDAEKMKLRGQGVI